MHYFTIEQREALQRQLEARAAELRAEVSEDVRADLNDEPEAAALARDNDELHAVEDSLLRLHQPEFGICEDCGGEIPYVRLMASPIARRCVACQVGTERAIR